MPDSGSDFVSSAPQSINKQEAEDKPIYVKKKGKGELTMTILSV